MKVPENREEIMKALKDKDFAKGFMLWAADLPDGAWQAAHDEWGIDVVWLYDEGEK